jgi:hypothetical protein
VCGQNVQPASLEPVSGRNLIGLFKYTVMPWFVLEEDFLIWLVQSSKQFWLVPGSQGSFWFVLVDRLMLMAQEKAGTGLILVFKSYVRFDLF